MSLDYDYGINTGNRFLDLVGHEEDPEEYIANQTQPAEKQKKSTKDSKTVTSTTATKKTTTTKPTSATTTTAAKTNKENVTGKSANTEQRRQQTNVLSDNNNQQTRGDSARGGGRGFGRRGGNAGQDRQPYEGGSRGGGQQRTQRYNKFEGQTPNESGWTEQSGDTWGNETGNDNQTFGGGYRGRGRGGGRGRGNYEGGRGNYEGGRGNYEGGRGNYEGGRGNYEGGRGNYEGGRGRGRGRGRGGFNRSFEEGSQQTQQTGDWQQNDSTVDTNRSETAQTTGQEFDTDVAPQERSFEPGNQRGGRGHYRSRTFHNNRNYGSGRPNQYEREGDQEESRQNRRQHDRQPRSYVSGVKPIEKRGGEGAHNWGSPTENPEEELATEEPTETPGDTAAPASKDWSQQVDEAEKQMTLDEYKKQIEEKKRAQQEKVPQFNPRAANEGVDPKQFKDFAQEYRKKNEGEESEEEVEEEDEENEEEEENDEEQQTSGKKKVINIPLYFKPIEMPRGVSRRGTGRFRPNRDEQTRSKSPSQQQYSYQQTGEYPNPDQQQQQQQQQPPQQPQQSRPYRGGPRQGSGRGEYRRSYGNSNRGSRGGYNRSNANSNTPDFDNTTDFPTLAKQ